ncbi:MAG: MBL fold metallo-hydrolase [Candidatus Bathyarchaeia archaeon]
MEIAEGVHLIKCPFSRYFTSVCALVGDEVTLIDSGMPSSLDEAILPYLNSLGRKPEDVAYVILTHGHFDHCGGAAELKKRFSAKVVVHELDRPLIEDPLLLDRLLYERFGPPPPPEEAPFPPVEPDITVKEGDFLKLSGRELAFLHLPGHSAGSMAVLDRKLGLYVAGDSPQGRGPGRPLLFHSLTEYENSMKRLSREAVNILILGHPFPPLEKPVLKDDEAKLHAQESLNAAVELREKVQTALNEARKPCMLEEVQAALPGTQRVSIGCVLEALVKAGEAETLKRGMIPLWAPAR